MPGVRVKDNESFAVTYRRFKRACERSGIAQELRKRERFQKPSMERKLAQQVAVRKQKRITQIEKSVYTKKRYI